MKKYAVKTYTMDIFTFDRKYLNTTVYPFLWMAKLHVLFSPPIIGTTIFYNEIEKGM